MNWSYIFDIVKQHKSTLIVANLIAIMSALLSVPVPLLMPMLVDEVLLDKPGMIIDFLQSIFPEQWLGPIAIIGIIMLASMLLRFGSLMLAVLQTREFTRIAKDISYRIRKQMLSHLQTISMAEYETMGTGSVTSHFVTDVNAVDEFLGSTPEQVHRSRTDDHRCCHHSALDALAAGPVYPVDESCGYLFHHGDG